MIQPTVQDMMSAYAQEAIEYSKRSFGVDLDYTEESVEYVEAILGKLHDNLPKGALSKLFKKSPSQEEIDQVSKMLGGYVGEVMRRNWGGQWKLESQAFPGKKVITFEIAGGGDVWPHFKAGKRIGNGPEDNIWHYFQVLKQKHVAK